MIGINYKFDKIHSFNRWMSIFSTNLPLPDLHIKSINNQFVDIHTHSPRVWLRVVFLELSSEKLLFLSRFNAHQSVSPVQLIAHTLRLVFCSQFVDKLKTLLILIWYPIATNVQILWVCVLRARPFKMIQGEKLFRSFFSIQWIWKYEMKRWTISF